MLRFERDLGFLFLAGALVIPSVHADENVSCKLPSGLIIQTASADCPKVGGSAVTDQSTQLYATWQANNRTEHDKAYQAAKSYLAQFPAEEHAPELQAWAKAYESVVPQKPATPMADPSLDPQGWKPATDGSSSQTITLVCNNEHRFFYSQKKAATGQDEPLQGFEEPLNSDDGDLEPSTYIIDVKNNQLLDPDGFPPLNISITTTTISWEHSYKKPEKTTETEIDRNTGQYAFTESWPNENRLTLKGTCKAVKRLF